MINRNAIALSLAAVLLSATGALAQTTHHRVNPRVERTVPQTSYNANARAQAFSGPHYYEPSLNGSVWSFYQGYVPSTNNRY